MIKLSNTIKIKFHRLRRNELFVFSKILNLQYFVQNQSILHYFCNFQKHGEVLLEFNLEFMKNHLLATSAIENPRGGMIYEALNVFVKRCFLDF